MSLAEINRLLDVVLFDVDGTLVIEFPPGWPTASLTPVLLPSVAADIQELAAFVRIGAATNTASMAEPDVRAHLAAVDIDQYLEVLVTSKDVGVAKPSPKMLHVACDRLRVIDKSRVLYVGDRSTDQQAALSAGMHFARAEEAGLRVSIETWIASELLKLEHPGH